MSAPILVKLCLSLSLSLAQSLSFSGSLAPGQNSCFAPEALWVWVAVAMPPVMADVLFPYVNTGNSKENNNTVATKLNNNNTISLGQTEDVCVWCVPSSLLAAAFIHADFTKLFQSLPCDGADLTGSDLTAAPVSDWIGLILRLSSYRTSHSPHPVSLPVCFSREDKQRDGDCAKWLLWRLCSLSLSLSLSECSCQLVEKTSSLFGRDEWTLEILSRKQSSKHNIQRIILVYFNLPYFPLMCLSIMTVSIANFALWRHRKTKSQTKWHMSGKLAQAPCSTATNVNFSMDGEKPADKSRCCVSYTHSMPLSSHDTPSTTSQFGSLFKLQNFPSLPLTCQCFSCPASPPAVSAPPPTQHPPMDLKL